ncbi:hypothetical protein B0H14DRAFT_2596893 [Mycena olivaceomarginata]|nr:hypothetical protein B0H14DRAFT_2596893 [Mycena olivaceomarginata]
MLPRPSVEDAGEDNNYRGAPPLLFTRNILQLASEPDLAPLSAPASRPDVDCEFTDPRYSWTGSAPAPNQPPQSRQSPSPADVGSFSRKPNAIPSRAVYKSVHAPSDTSLSKRHLREDPGDYPATRWAQHLDYPQVPSATSLGKRRLREDPGDNSATNEPQYPANSQDHPISHVGGVRFHTEGPYYNTGTEYGPPVDSSPFNASHTLRPSFNIHRSHALRPSESDPALTYLPGYRALVSPQSVVPMEPVTESAYEWTGVRFE